MERSLHCQFLAMPNPPTLQQIIQDGIQLVDDVAKKAGPLLTKAYAFSQVAGKLMASENDAGPPASYYIADPDPGSPHPTGTKAPDPGSSYTNVAGTTIDQAAGFPLAGTDIGVYMGPGMSSLAVAVSSHANGSPITSGNPTILCGAGQLPLAGVGQSTATGEPVIDGYPEGVQMAMPRSWSPDGKHAIYTAQGTGPTPWDNNFGNLAAECGSDARVAPYYTWLAIDYPAQTFPMGPGIDAGVKDLVNQISNREGKFALVGYSQGAIITCRVWRDEILNPNGQLHDRLGDIFAHVTFGNPMRCPGIAHGNALVPYDLPMPLDGYVTGGIAGPDDLTPWQTAPWHMDFAHDGDMYAAAPVGADPWSNESPVGRAETSIYNIMMLKFFGQDTIIPEIGEILIDPVPSLIAVVEGLINTIGFFGAGQVPHTIYRTDGSYDKACEFLEDRGSHTPA